MRHASIFYNDRTHHLIVTILCTCNMYTGLYTHYIQGGVCACVCVRVYVCVHASVSMRVCVSVCDMCTHKNYMHVCIAHVIHTYTHRADTKVW